jgi:hypothetical protein
MPVAKAPTVSRCSRRLSMPTKKEKPIMFIARPTRAIHRIEGKRWRVEQTSFPGFVKLVHFIELLAEERLFGSRAGLVPFLDASVELVPQGVGAEARPSLAH